MRNHASPSSFNGSGCKAIRSIVPFDDWKVLQRKSLYFVCQGVIGERYVCESRNNLILLMLCL